MTANKRHGADPRSGLPFIGSPRDEDDHDTGRRMPGSDTEDFSKGARFIPSRVTLERRRGKRVIFAQQCSANCWYWEFEDGSRHYHYDGNVYDSIGRRNHEEWDPKGRVLAGSCPDCGNPHTRGGPMTTEEVQALSRLT